MNGPGGGGGAPTPGAAGGGGGGPAGAAGAAGPGAGARVRRSRSQGTRKLHKCLSTASDVYAAPPAPQHSLLTTRQYCSFGSTVTLYRVLSAKSPSVLRQSQFLPFGFFFLFVMVSILAAVERSLAPARRLSASHAARIVRSILSLIGLQYCILADTYRPAPILTTEAVLCLFTIYKLMRALCY